MHASETTRQDTYLTSLLLIAELSRCNIDFARLSAAVTTASSVSAVNGLSSVSTAAYFHI